MEILFSFPSSGSLFLFLPRHRTPLRGLVVSRVLRPKAASASPELNCEGGAVDVVGIGSRKDTIINFCLDALSASSPRLRFWTIHSRDSSNVKLLHKSSGKDTETKVVDYPLLCSCRPGIIIVASAGHGPDDVIALELLNGVKSTGGLSVTILLKPFRFEGPRRQQKVNTLMSKLQRNSQLYVVVETDALLRTKDETLEEAVKTVNNTVLSVIRAISALVSDKDVKFLDAPDEQVKELVFADILNLLEKFGESKVGCGAAHDVKSSIVQAMLNSSIHTSDLKGANGIVVLAISSAVVMDMLELHKVVRTFRQITKCNKKIIFFGLHESGIEREVVITTLLALGCSVQNSTPEKGFLSNLIEAFPFLLAFSWRKSNGNDISVTEAGTVTDNGIYGTERTLKAGFLEANNTAVVEEEECPQEDQPDSWILGPAFDFAKEWAKERASISGTIVKPEGLEIFTLPVGIKFPQMSDEGKKMLETAESVTLDGAKGESLDALYFSTNEMMGRAGLEVLMDMYNSALSVLRRKNALSTKPGVLSVRAATMLEAERESAKVRALVSEMEYRGGLFRGRCQGGLPEGKGCLKLDDGSYYDGMWKFGKRSGFGTFCYSNGDMYQGMWRDDVVHGKGWFYFHTGDRWFSNFWKGKANGEGRFYSKSGSVYFGHFRNGLRHGEGLHMDADGSRWSEVWEDGILTRREQVLNDNVGRDSFNPQLEVDVNQRHDNEMLC